MTPADVACVLGIAALLILRELLPELARIWAGDRKDKRARNAAKPKEPKP